MLVSTVPVGVTFYSFHHPWSLLSIPYLVFPSFVLISWGKIRLIEGVLLIEDAQLDIKYYQHLLISLCHFFVSSTVLPQASCFAMKKTVALPQLLTHSIFLRNINYWLLWLIWNSPLLLGIINERRRKHRRIALGLELWKAHCLESTRFTLCKSLYSWEQHGLTRTRTDKADQPGELWGCKVQNRYIIRYMYFLSDLATRISLYCSSAWVV